MIELKDVLTILGLAVTVGGIFFAMFRWTVMRIEQRHSEAMDHTEKRHGEVMEHISTVHVRVNEVKDQYVKRSDLDRDFKMLERRLESTEKSIADGRVETNQRLDRMLMLLGKLISGKPGDLD